jgi:hypothetical protein
MINHIKKRVVMVKRILDCRGSDLRQMGKKELKQAILAAEGRTIIAETVVTSQPLLPEVSNPEVMKAFGADMIYYSTCSM